ncbi:DUF927 domain-containing protein [Bradyrhizobium cenepequi]
MSEHAKEYLAKVLPWPQEGEPPAYVNIHWTLTKLNSHTGKPIWTGRACRSVQEAANTVEWALRGSDTKDIYVCMSTQLDALEKTSGKGHKYLAPLRSQENAVKLKSLFVDLDAKGEDKNSYATIPEAAAALAKFITEVDLPKPSAIVTSGGGLHVYWTFDRALTIDEWQPLAFALAEATKKHGLKCDTGCTIDSARILRVPGTFNRKLDTARPVGLAGGRTGNDYSVERLERSLEPYKVAIPTSAAALTTLPRRPPLKGESDLSAGVDRGASAPVDLCAVATQCGFIRDAIATNGAQLANPLWNLTTLISTFAINGRNEAHRMASGHPGYTLQSTDELYDRKERERAAKGLGWPSCRTVSASGAPQCVGCPHFAAGKSPLNFAPKPQATLVVAPSTSGGSPVNPPAGAGAGQPGAIVPNADLPPGYKRLGNGIVCRILINSDGSAQDEPISTYPMFDPLIQPSPVYTLFFSTITEVGRTTRIALPTKEISAKDGLKRNLWGQGLPLREVETKAVTEFIVSWLEHLQKNKSMVVSSAPFGWSLHGGKIEGFIFGGSIWTPTGDRQAAVPSAVIERQYRPEGDIQPWIDAAKLITSQGRPALDAILASAFAAPLMKFTREPGILLSTYSQESGIGKTTTMKIAQAVWGNPKTAMQGTSDTHNGIMNKIGQIRVLPLYWDEIKTEEDSKRFVKIVFDLTRGQEKARSSQTGELRESGQWQTMLVSASNDSITDAVVGQTKQTLAGYYRVFEYAIASGKGGKGQINSTDATQLVGKIDDNYGVVGLEYAKFLGKNHKTIEKEVEAFDKAIGLELKLENEERFWRVMLTALLSGAKYANDLNFTTIDIPALKQFLVGVITEMRSNIKAQPVDMEKVDNVSNALAQFLGDKRARHTLRTNKIHTTAGKPPANTISVVGDASRLDAIEVHLGVEDKLLRISSSRLTAWLMENGYSRHMFVKSLEKTFGAKMIKGRIGAGTQYAGAKEYILEISLTGTTHANFIDEA